MKQSLAVTVIAVLAVGAASFYGGMQYGQQNRRSQFNRDFGGNTGSIQNQRGGAMMNGNRMGFRGVNGEIIAADDKSITVKMSDGTSRIVIISESTSINKASNASKLDLKNGEKVAIFGQTNTDGSITAQSIQLNPIFRTGGPTDQSGNQQKISPTQ